MNIKMAESKDLVNNSDSVKCKCELNPLVVFPLNHPVCACNWRLAEKLFHIISDQFSRNMFERHDHIANEFLQFFHEGFFLRDMHAITNILATFFERYHEHPPYVNHIKCILNIFGDNILRTESRSDQIEFIIATSNIISLIGYYIQTEPNFKTLLVLTLLSLSTLIGKRKECQYNNFFGDTDASKFKPVTDAFIMTSFEESTLCESLIELLKINEDYDFVFAVDVINILNNLAEMSSKNCENILKSDGLEVICHLMNIVPDVDLSTRVRFWVLELLWHMIKKVSSETAKVLSSKKCMESLRNAFFTTLKQSNGTRIKQLRNDFLLLFLLILQNSHEKINLPELFIKELSVLATLPDKMRHQSNIAKVHFEESWEDYEMDEFLFCILNIVTARGDYLSFLNPRKLIESLLVHLNPLPLDPNGKKSRFLSHKKTIQILALQILTIYATEFIRIFLDLNTDYLIIKQIIWCFSENVLTRRRYTYERDVFLRLCIKILVKIARTRNQEVLHSLIQLNAVEHMLKIVNDTYDMPYEAPYIDFIVRLQCLAFLILACLCNNGGDATIASLGADGEDAIIKYLKKLSTKENRALPGHNLLLTSVLNCVRCGIIGIPIMENSFKAQNGVNYLLDLLLNSHSSIQDLILTCLADLCVSSNSAVQILKWRGPKKMTAPALFCHLWRKEEERLGIKRDDIDASKHALIAFKQFFGTGKLLIGKHQSQIIAEAMPSYRMSASILDVSENFRAKIFGLIEYIKEQGSEREPPLELARLPLEEMSTLAVIEGYLDLKGGEVWCEVLDELAIEKLDPLTLEQEFIYSVSRIITNRVASIMGFQSQCRILLQDKLRNDANNYYQQFYEWKNQEKLLVTKTYQYLAKTSNAQTLSLLKERDRLELSLEQHKTTIKKLESMKPERDVKSFHLRH